MQHVDGIEHVLCGSKRQHKERTERIARLRKHKADRDLQTNQPLHERRNPSDQWRIHTKFSESNIRQKDATRAEQTLHRYTSPILWR